MITALQLLDRNPILETRERRRLRLRNHLFNFADWERARSAATAFPDILKASLRKGATAAMQMAMPISVVQTLMVALVIGILFITPVQDFFQRVVDFKTRMGLPFAFLSMGTIAVFAECLRRIGRPREPFWAAAAYGFAVFGGLGVLTDLFCVLLEILWGGLSPVSQVAAKMMTDQFVYTVLLANPYQTLLLVWKDCGFSREKFTARTRPFAGFYVREMLPVLITNWAFWIPTTLVLYCLPMDIQFVIRLFAIVIWVLLLTAMTKTNGGK